MRNTMGDIALSSGFQRLLGSSYYPVVRSGRSGHPVRRCHGYRLVGYTGHRKWTCQRPSDLCPRSADNGAGSAYTLLFVTLPASAPFIVSGMKQAEPFSSSLMSAKYIPILTGLGLGQLLHFGRAQFHGAGHGHHVRYYSHRTALRQTPFSPWNKPSTDAGGLI